MRVLALTEAFLGVLIAAALASPGLAQEGSVSEPAAAAVAADVIARPVWEQRPAAGLIPAGVAVREIRIGASLRCKVRGGSLVDCRPVDSVPQVYLDAAVRSASGARLAATDADGQPTEGREIVVNIGFPIPVAIDPPPAPPVTRLLTGVEWSERPTAENYRQYYPQEALAQSASGTIMLDCLVSGDGRISCAVLSEDPPNMGFGVAALRIARHFRMAAETQSGERTAGGRARVPITFQPE